MLDVKIPILLTGAPPEQLVTISLAGADGTARWTSSATFISDRSGTVDVSRMVPIAGTYRGLDPMGLFWSAQPDRAVAGGRLARSAQGPHMPMPWELIAEIGGNVVAKDTVWRRAVTPDVRVMRVRDGGIVGTFYEPPGAGKHPAIIVMPGSQGGTPPPIGPAGGYASRGYAVLALAYFNDEGLPDQIMNIPLEYFERATNWLRAQPSVDPNRIAIQGGSRGGEAALLIAATYPKLVRAVIAVAPSSVIWSGCCQRASFNQPSWTLNGKPLPFVPPVLPLGEAFNALSTQTPTRMAGLFLHRLQRDSAIVARATIPVERINGPVLLLSGANDGMWPSTYMAEQVVARLKAHNFRHPVTHISYEDAGHGMVLRPYGSTMVFNDVLQPVSRQRNDHGGTPSGTARAREAAWNEQLKFLDRYLRDTR